MDKHKVLGEMLANQVIEIAGKKYAAIILLAVPMESMQYAGTDMPVEALCSVMPGLTDESFERFIMDIRGTRERTKKFFGE